MFSWFSSKQKISESLKLTTDIHSHLLPGLDDGVKTFEESKEIILYFKKLGYKKIITTPHIMIDAYKNSPASILGKLSKLKTFLSAENIEIEIEAAAEYYLDQELMNSFEKDEKLLTFGKRYILFETNFLTEPLNLKEFIFIATTKGYTPVLAHPERYLYLQNNIEKLEDLLNRGVLFQVNVSSITGYYSKQSQQTARKLIDKGWIHFLGSDCHHLKHIQLTEEASQLKYYHKALSLPLLNNTL